MIRTHTHTYPEERKRGKAVPGFGRRRSTLRDKNLRENMEHMLIVFIEWEKGYMKNELWGGES